MSVTATLLELRLRVRRRADMENSTFVTDDKDEVDFYINAAVSKLRKAVNKADEGAYFGKSGTISTIANTDTYTLPTDFAKMIRVNVATPGGEYADIPKFSLRSIGTRRSERGWNVSSGSASAQYRVIGGNLVFIPAPSAVHTVELWYMPHAPRLTTTSDVFTGEDDDWINFVISDAAVALLTKEESDASAQKQDAMEALARIIDDITPRDLNEPDCVADVYSSYQEDYLAPEWRHP